MCKKKKKKGNILVLVLIRYCTCADVHDVVEGVHALDDVHHQVGEAHVVLHDQRIDGLRLHHVVHQVEPLGVLQAALRQTVVGTLIVDGTALERRRPCVRSSGSFKKTWQEMRRQQCSETAQKYNREMTAFSQLCLACRA